MAKIADISGIGPAHAEKFAAAGIKTVEGLLKAGATPKSRMELSAQTGFAEKSILEWVNRADLARIKGVGEQYADLLETAGVDTVAELASRNAANLHETLGKINAEKQQLIGVEYGTAEYEAVKAGRSPLFKRVGDFYRHHGTCSQTFRKYYNRYLQSGDEADLLPRRRGPKWRERREPEGIEAEIVACRQKGMNRYEIHAVLHERRDTIPSPSTIYRVLTRYGLNRRTPAMPSWF